MRGGCRFRPPLSISLDGGAGFGRKTCRDRTPNCVSSDAVSQDRATSIDETDILQSEGRFFVLPAAVRKKNNLAPLIRRADGHDVERRELKGRPPSKSERASTFVVVARLTPSILSSPRNFGAIRPVDPTLHQLDDMIERLSPPPRPQAPSRPPDGPVVP